MLEPVGQPFKMVQGLLDAVQGCTRCQRCNTGGAGIFKVVAALKVHS